MTLVIPKDHYDSDLFKLDDDLLSKHIKATKKVVALLKKGLQVDRV
jgi:diadenosine tetraphosphate (Ap4A) HIT family hydrolase